MVVSGRETDSWFDKWPCKKGIMKIRKPLSLFLPPCLVGVYMYPNPRLGHGSRHPSPTLRPTVLPFRIGARVSLAIQIHFLHDITGEIYTVAVITVWRDCLHFGHIVEKRTPQLLRWLRQPRGSSHWKSFTGFRRDGSFFTFC